MAAQGCRAGKYRTAYSVERQSSVKDSTGHDVEAWNVLIETRRGQYIPGTPKEYYNNAGEAASISGRLYFHFDQELNDVKPGDRFLDKHSNEIYQVIGFAQNFGNKDKELIFNVEHLNRN